MTHLQRVMLVLYMLTDHEGAQLRCRRNSLTENKLIPMTRGRWIIVSQSSCTGWCSQAHQFWPCEHQSVKTDTQTNVCAFIFDLSGSNRFARWLHSVAMLKESANEAEISCDAITCLRDFWDNGILKMCSSRRGHCNVCISTAFAPRKCMTVVFTGFIYAPLNICSFSVTMAKTRLLKIPHPPPPSGSWQALPCHASKLKQRNVLCPKTSSSSLAWPHASWFLFLPQSGGFLLKRKRITVNCNCLPDLPNFSFLPSNPAYLLALTRHCSRAAPLSLRRIKNKTATKVPHIFVGENKMQNL